MPSRWLQAGPTGKQELPIDPVGLHGLQGIGDDRIQLLGGHLRPGPAFQLGRGLQGEADSGSGVWETSEPGQQIRHGFELEGPGAGLSTEFFGPIRIRPWLEIGHRGRHEQKIVPGPEIGEFPLQVRRGLEPNGPDLRMRARIDRSWASEKGDRVAAFGRRSGDFRPEST